MCRVVAPHGECEDNSVSDEQLRNSDEFPRLDLMFALELVRIAEADCAEFATCMKSLREAQLSCHQVVTGRQFYKFYLVYFARNVNEHTTYQWMDLDTVKCERGDCGSSAPTGTACVVDSSSLHLPILC